MPRSYSPDETAEACLPRADKRVRDDFAKQLADDARKGKGIDNIETIAHQTDVQVVRATTCALPVWLMHCSWQDNQMLFAVNGASGKCVGDLPISKGKTLAWFFGTFAAVAAVVATFLYLL